MFFFSHLAGRYIQAYAGFFFFESEYGIMEGVVKSL